MDTAPLRVVYVIDDLGHGGAQRQLFLAAGTLAAQADVQVVVLSDQVEPYARRLRDRGVAVVVIPRRSPLEALRVRSLLDAVRRARAQVVHGFLDASNAYAFLAARALRAPVVLSLRSDRLRLTGPRAVALRWMLRHADAVTVNSVSGHDYLLRTVGVRTDRVHTIPNTVVVPPLPSAPAAATPGLIGCVGRLTAVKRFESVIEALPAVRRSHPAARLVIVGDGPCRRRLADAAARAGVAAEVEFAGALDDPTPVVAGCTCLVVASEHEGLTNAALEALALGVPVVSVPAGDLPRVVVDGVTGVLARDGSVAALAEAISLALASPALHASAAREGPRLVRERFAGADASRRLLDLYRGLACRTGRANESGAVIPG